MDRTRCDGTKESINPSVRVYLGNRWAIQLSRGRHKGIYMPDKATPASPFTARPFSMPGQNECLTDD